jgi:hypothetical protein
MAYKKFDDPSEKVDATKYGVYDATVKEGIRRALQGISNRVIGGSNGTQGPLITPGLATGATAGFSVGNAVSVVRNGVISTVAAAANLLFPELGTLGKNKVTKFLVCTKDGTSGTIVGPGNIVDKGDYASATLAAAAAKIPDLPDGACALGYVTLNAPAATALVLTDGASTAAAKLGYVLGTGGTAGTATYVNLVCMPYDG